MASNVQEVEVSFVYYANPEHFGTADPEAIAKLVKAQIDLGEVDMVDLLDEDNIETVRVKPL